ncbi:MAG: phosphonate ABC transporter ATP-binding protein [Alphaproteobacteria bacterium]|nr:phosphonate ABC transporter ATP-binding protein [Alphaproteobacteria bacterium]
MADLAISVDSLSKTFGRNKALDEVSIGVEAGEMIALIGASGSGKSTLIRHIAGLVASDKDSCCKVRVFGETVQIGGKITPEARRLRSRIGVIFQQFNLVGRLGLLTNVVIGVLGRIPKWRGTIGWFTHDEKMLAMEALARVGMDQYAGQRASTLSGGQQQRAAIARALVQQAEVLLADEPIASLDPESARRVMDALATINSEDGITVVVSLHQVAYAKKYCERTIALRDGKVVFDGPSSRLTTEFLRELYGADSEELIMDETMPSAAPAPAPETQAPVRPKRPAQERPDTPVPAYAAE